MMKTIKAGWLKLTFPLPISSPTNLHVKAIVERLSSSTCLCRELNHLTRFRGSMCFISVNCLCSCFLKIFLDFLTDFSEVNLKATAICTQNQLGFSLSISSSFRLKQTSQVSENVDRVLVSALFRCVYTAHQSNVWLRHTQANPKEL